MLRLFTSAVYLNVNDLSRVDFVLKLNDAGIFKVGDVSLIEDKIRYPFSLRNTKREVKVSVWGCQWGATGTFNPVDFLTKDPF